MPKFNVLYTLEYDPVSDKIQNPIHNPTYLLDCQLIVLYDQAEEKFYYYGTRSYNITKDHRSEIKVSSKDDKYIQFAGAYPESKLSTFITFLSLLNDKFTRKITVEMHQIELTDDEYNSKLDYAYLLKKLSRRTEMFAYDKITETEGSIMEKIDMLTAEII
jgi:hypothetical protein